MSVRAPDSSPSKPPSAPAEADAPKAKGPEESSKPDSSQGKTSQAPEAPKDEFETSKPRPPVDLSGGNNQAPMSLDDYFALKGGQNDSMMMLKGGADDPQVQQTPPAAPAKPHDATTPTDGVAPADVDPANHANKDKLGAVINAKPKDWPTVDQLQSAGVTAVRITAQGGPDGNLDLDEKPRKDPKNPDGPELPPDPEKSPAAWNAKLAEYRKAGIDVTLNMPVESADAPLPQIPMDPARTQGAVLATQREEKGGPNNPPTDPTFSVIPFKSDGTRSDGGEMSPEQAAKAKEWYGQFNDWKRDHYLPTLQKAQDKLGANVNRYEIWNEPDEPANWHHPSSGPGDREQGYQPAIPPQAFGELLKASKEQLQRGTPQGQEVPKVVSGGLDSGNPAYLQQAMDATGGTLHADEIGLHPYLKRPDSNYGDPAEWTGTLTDIRDAYEKVAPGKPIEFTEVGDKRAHHLTPPASPDGKHQPEDELGTDWYVPAAATAMDKVPDVQHGYFFWENPYDGDFGLNRRVVDDEASGASHLVPQKSLNKLSARTHSPEPK